MFPSSAPRGPSPPGYAATERKRDGERERKGSLIPAYISLSVSLTRFLSRSRHPDTILRPPVAVAVLSARLGSPPLLPPPPPPRRTAGAGGKRRRRLRDHQTRAWRTTKDDAQLRRARTKWGRSKKSFSLRGKRRRGDILHGGGRQTSKQTGRQTGRASPYIDGIEKFLP